ncbi:MAG: exodeoxyribonuclease VII large subunit [Desulfovibrionaceae bacterium]|nr:exodeoxyribonuclease VII large subunit [Desulfovibrionaceae bacterium]
MNGKFESAGRTRLDTVYTVSALTESVKRMLENGFPFVWVRGQISNLSRPGSGHLYFSLQDEEASLAVVWFKNQQREVERFDPLTGELYDDGPRPGAALSLENGQEVLCAGRLSLYAPRGTYQLVAELVREAGKSRRQMEYELLQAEFARKGYFDPRRKRPLPVHPRRVGLVTSPHGAAVHDFLRLAWRRGLPAEIRIYPSLVQGGNAPAELAGAMRLAQDWAETMVLLRGGGSQEDLWAFNSREVVEAIFASPVPVLCGVGHEVDVTLADLVADLRAATPSHAAYLLFKDRRELTQTVDEADLALRGALAARLRLFSENLALREKSLRLLSPIRRLERDAILLRAEEERLKASMRAKLEQASSRLALYGDAARLKRAWDAILERARACLEQALLRLDALDPHLPLNRGYALVRGEGGDFLRGRKEAAPGEKLEVLFHDGTVPVRVEK